MYGGEYDIRSLESPFESNELTQRYCHAFFVNLEIPENELEKKEEYFRKMMKLLTTPPQYTTLRINTLRVNGKQLMENLASLLKIGGISFHACIKDLLIIPSPRNNCVGTISKIEIVVDSMCGAAVMRGAHVYLPGVMAALPCMKSGDNVSIFVDIEGKCRKGFTKIFTGRKIFVGNGTAKLSREEIFTGNISSGIAVEVTEPIFCCPSLSSVLVNEIFPQNLPSIVCGHVLSPKPQEIILDMCAAPGGKTSHLATLMEDTGIVVAFDKTSTKVNRIIELCQQWCITCVKPFVFDGIKSWDPTLDKAKSIAEIENGPPFASNTFDRILLDAPCSALGQRPQFQNQITISQLKSYVPLQRKLFRTAVGLLRTGGILVYSTCTLALEENEGLVKWALDTFPNLQLEFQEPHIGSIGMKGSGLTSEQLGKLQRFPLQSEELTSSVESDTIGFFIAKFSKL